MMLLQRVLIIDAHHISSPSVPSLLESWINASNAVRVCTIIRDQTILQQQARSIPSRILWKNCKTKEASTAKASESPNPKGKRKAAASPAKKKKSRLLSRRKIVLERSDMKRAVLTEKNTYLRIMSTNVAGLRGLLRNGQSRKILKVVGSEGQI